MVALTGHLGAGKTTLLNHLLRQPGARVGVVVNDFGEINVDAGLVTGQVDEPASIAGGCICCLPDAGGLDEALEKLTHPRLGLDVVLVEASGIAEPVTLARLIRFSGVERVRPGGVIEVIDAVQYFDTLDTGSGDPPARFEVTTLVILNKCDLLPADSREQTLTAIEERIRLRNPYVTVLRTSGCRIDPTLVYDAALTEDPPDQLPIGALLREAAPAHHVHAQAVSARSPGPVDPGRLLDLLEDPPTGAYRIKGTVAVRSAGRVRGYLVNVVGRSIHVSSHPTVDASELVAIGTHLDGDAVRARLDQTLRPAGDANPDGFRRLQRRRRLSL